MKVILLITCLAVVNASSSFADKWHSFKAQHRKTYRNAVEEAYRKSVFVENLRKIEEHNAKYALGLASYGMKMNYFGDLLPDEATGLMMQAGKPLWNEDDAVSFLPPANVILPKTMDWRKEGAVTGVKNQGVCGSCWAFSSTASLEGQLFRKTGRLSQLSEQQLLDCAEDNWGNLGCHGGDIYKAFRYVLANRGMAKEEDYPYEGKVVGCRLQNKNLVNGTQVKGFVKLPEGDEGVLAIAVATAGPVAVEVTANNTGFRFYSEGVFSGEECQEKRDHGVVVVGYGTEDGKDYWILKNSWSEAWGERGYMKLARNKNNACKVASAAFYPLL